MDVEDIPSDGANNRVHDETCCSSKDDALFDSYERLINPSYPKFLTKLGLNRVATRAEGATITDSQGKTYIDCIAGYGLFNLGHNHPGVIQALTEQFNDRQQFTKPFITEIQVKLAENLQSISPGDLTCSFMCNSGSEAIDSALKLVRLHKRGKQIISIENSFHGYTFGVLSVSGIPSFKSHFEPLVPGIVHIPYGDLEALKKTMSIETSAVIIQPIQHEAGIVLPPEGYLQEVRSICDEQNTILILDEIKTGLGKTGSMFACDHFGVVPDILVVGKSLGGGLMPVGAMIAKSYLWKKFGMSFPMSASSFAGNVLACRAAIATIQFIQQNGLLGKCATKGQLLLGKLREQVRQYPEILKSANGLGLLMGITTHQARFAFSLAREMIRQGVLVVPAFGNPAALMVEPALVINSQQIDMVVNAFAKACAKVDRER